MDTRTVSQRFVGFLTHALPNGRHVPHDMWNDALLVLQLHAGSPVKRHFQAGLLAAWMVDAGGN